MKKFLVFIVSIILAISLTACNVSGGETDSFVNPGDSLGGGGTGIATSEADVSEELGAIESAGKTDLGELSENTDSSGAQEVVQDGDDAFEISAAGSYVLTGEYPSGVHITAKKGAAIHLFLSGATITGENGCALYSDKKMDTVITVVDGTQNVISNKVTDVSVTDTFNAVHIKGDLSINGGGKLTVVSESKSGIKASGILKITDAEIEVEAASHGFTAQTVIAENCKLTVTSGKDGIQAESSDYEIEDDDGNVTYAYVTTDGYVSLGNVTYTATTYGDGIQADTFVYIDGGKYDITTKGVWVNYSSANMTTYELTKDDYRWTKSGNTYKKVASDEVNRYSTNNLYAFAQGCKGIKVGELEYDITDDDGNVTSTVAITDGDYNILIKSGEFNINSSDDAIHANSGNVVIKGGTYSISTLDDGLTADNLCRIEGGEIKINTSYEGIEGAYVEITGGSVDVYATDDGINAASDDTTVTEHIIISGGTVVVNSDGDGIDSNGDIQIKGGTTIVYGPTSSGDASLDAENGILVYGGYLFAAGSLGMVETPARNSTQYVVSLATQSAVSANTEVSLVDASGNAIMSVTTKKNCNSIIMSCPEMAQGATYTVYGGGTSLGSFTVTSIITTIGSSSGGMQGPGGFGGGPGGPGGRR
ncbi:MAG: carbohydrate-binding domain-containing protein [Clostridia bacterium]|nr:carbohydrate-binding domain-containing protein [Clostridia bacterium]